MRATKSQRPQPPRKKRSSALLFAQIGGGGAVGIMLAIVILRVLGADYFGFGRAPEGPVGISEKRDLARNDPPKASANKPVKPQQPRTKQPSNSRTTPRDQGSENPPQTFDEPPKFEEPPAAPPEKTERVPLDKEAIGAFFAKAQISPACKLWWTSEGVFELDDRAGMKFAPRVGAPSHYWPAASTDQYLELDNEAHNQRIRLFADHAEFAADPFEKYVVLYASGKWITPPEQSGVDGFPKAINEVEIASRQSRVTAKEYMTNLFAAAEKLKTANKLKDVPFGFDLKVEKDRFDRMGLVPWTAPLLPMTAEYIQECRKMHKNEEAAYNRIALRLNGQREKLAKDFLEYHQWRFARAWPLGVVTWKDDSGADKHHTLYSNGAVDDETSSDTNKDASKDTWKLTGDILDVAVNGRRFRLKINQQGKEFTIIGSEPPATGKFLFEPVKVAY